jgi:hypothetical protein
MTGLQEPGAYGSQMAKYFRLSGAPSLVIRPLSKPQIAITRLTCHNGLPEQIASIPREKAFVVSVHRERRNRAGPLPFRSDRDGIRHRLGNRSAIASERSSDLRRYECFQDEVDSGRH